MTKPDEALDDFESAPVVLWGAWSKEDLEAAGRVDGHKFVERKTITGCTYYIPEKETPNE